MHEIEFISPIEYTPPHPPSCLGLEKESGVYLFFLFFFVYPLAGATFTSPTYVFALLVSTRYVSCPSWVFTGEHDKEKQTDHTPEVVWRKTKQ